MAKRLGVSIYPERSTPEKDIAYLQLASRYGFERVFTCLLSVEGDRAEVLEQLQPTIAEANRLGMEVIIDVAPPVFKRLDISYDDLSFFAELGVSGIRLDEAFDGHKEAMMSYNPYGLKIEMNMSAGTRQIENVLSFQANRHRVIGCHNFYPQNLSGLDYEQFMKCSQQFKQLQLHTAAFISSSEATFGPWPVTEGLCTLEMHRKLPITVQAKHMFATDVIDDVMIGNAYASEAELKALSELNRELVQFRIEFADTATELEKKIVLEEPHFVRGDISSYMFRSTQSRVKFKAEEFPAHSTNQIERGDILIPNEHYGQYKGELQIALQSMENDGRKNVVGKIAPEELFLLDFLKPWSHFRFHV